jgi:WD40 repeat protein
VLATSSRDGSVYVWDLRCRGSDRPAREVHVALNGDVPVAGPVSKTMTYAVRTNGFTNAHQNAYKLRRPCLGGDAPSRTEKCRETAGVSITAISFLPSGQEHLLLSACESNSTVKLWDLRSTYNSRANAKQMPLSSTCEPDSHRWRQWGIGSMNISSDGARLYTLCKDNTIYAYSTAHLVLGSAPELSSSTSRPRKLAKAETGLGPLYGFRHPKFHASTFYVKSSLRPARLQHTEILAVGSSDGCAVLFPTDERYLSQSMQNGTSGKSEQDLAGNASLLQRDSIQHSRLPSSRSSSALLGASMLANDTIPIYYYGTALIRGHDNMEVGPLTWTIDGELVTSCDDYTIRCWREGNDARDLRNGGEASGRRWRCGWADVEDFEDVD